MCRLPALAALDVNTCRVAELPEAFTALAPTLTSLDLGGNRQLAPEPLRRQLAHLPNLQRFCAGGCGAKLPAALADTLAALPLHYLAVNGNKLLATPQGGGPAWKPLFEAVEARRTAAPPAPGLPTTEQPPGLLALEASIARADWDAADDAAEFY